MSLKTPLSGGFNTEGSCATPQQPSANHPQQEISSQTGNQRSRYIRDRAPVSPQGWALGTLTPPCTLAPMGMPPRDQMAEPRGCPHLWKAFVAYIWNKWTIGSAEVRRCVFLFNFTRTKYWLFFQCITNCENILKLASTGNNIIKWIKSVLKIAWSWDTVMMMLTKWIYLQQ